MGRLAALTTTAEGWQCVGLDGETATLYQAKQAGLTCWSLFVGDGFEGPAVVGYVAQRGPVIWAPGRGRGHFMRLDFSGRADANTQVRSNRSGIGVVAAVRVGSRWTGIDTYRNASGPGQSLQPVAVGLGRTAAADFVSITWPDGVLETVIDLAAGKRHRIEEKNRLPTSCPLLFAWNGRRFAFVTDCLGVAGLGYATGPGRYAPVRPWENILLPAGDPARLDGRLQLKLAEPMEELTYLDSAALVAYDLPPGWQMTLDERAAANEPAPTGAPRFYRDAMAPARAIDERGIDVTAAILAADRIAAPLGAPDPRFIGRNQEQVLTLTFPRPINAHRGAPLLVVNGWIEFPYSQTMFAAWQAGAAYHPPSLEARDAAGHWRTVLRGFGYPGGMSRAMSVPLVGLPPGCREIRLRTNQEVYSGSAGRGLVGAVPKGAAASVAALGGGASLRGVSGGARSVPSGRRASPTSAAIRSTTCVIRSGFIRGMATCGSWSNGPTTRWRRSAPAKRFTWNLPLRSTRFRRPGRGGSSWKRTAGARIATCSRKMATRSNRSRTAPIRPPRRCAAATPSNGAAARASKRAARSLFENRHIFRRALPKRGRASISP